MHLRNVSRVVRLSEFKRSLKASHIPIFLTSTKLFGGAEALPHWAVLTGYSDDAWYVNNPLANSPGQRIGQARLKDNLGYRDVQCAVVVGGLSRQRMRWRP
jgi:hypothetical protein